MTLPPAIANQIIQAILEQIEKLVGVGGQPVILCSPQIRLLLRRLIAPHLSNIAILAYNEIVKGVNIESVGMVVIK